MKGKRKRRLTFRRLLPIVLPLVVIAGVFFVFTFPTSASSIFGLTTTPFPRVVKPHRKLPYEMIQHKAEYHDELEEAAELVGISREKERNWGKDLLDTPLHSAGSGKQLKEKAHAEDATGQDLVKRWDEQSKFLLVTLISGPNNQIHGLKEGILLARLLGRVLVLPQIMVHYNLFHKYKVKQMYEFGEVFDVGPLATFVPTISWQEFRELSGGQVDVWRIREDEKCLNYERKFLTSFNLTARSVTMLPRWENRELTTSLTPRLRWWTCLPGWIPASSPSPACTTTFSHPASFPSLFSRKS
jgi:hypothetical protein